MLEEQSPGPHCGTSISRYEVLPECLDFSEAHKLTFSGGQANGRNIVICGWRPHDGELRSEDHYRVKTLNLFYLGCSWMRYVPAESRYASATGGFTHLRILRLMRYCRTREVFFVDRRENIVCEFLLSLIGGKVASGPLVTLLSTVYNVRLRKYCVVTTRTHSHIPTFSHCRSYPRIYFYRPHLRKRHDGGTK